MTKLEQNLITSASHSLKLLTTYFESDDVTEDETNDFITNSAQFFALVEFSHLVDSGMTPEAIAALQSLEEQHSLLVRSHTPSECSDAAIAAIQFALETDEGLTFLQLWNTGEFDSIRREWPDAPESVFIGADPLHVTAFHSGVGS